MRNPPPSPENEAPRPTIIPNRAIKTRCRVIVFQSFGGTE